MAPGNCDRHFLIFYRPNLQEIMKMIVSWSLQLAYVQKKLLLVDLHHKAGWLRLNPYSLQRTRETDALLVKSLKSLSLSHTHTHARTHSEVAQCNLLPATEQLHWSRCRFSAAFKGISTAVMDGWVPLVQFIHPDPHRHPGDSNRWLQSLGSWRIFKFTVVRVQGAQQVSKLEWELKLVGSNCLMSDRFWSLFFFGGSQVRWYTSKEIYCCSVVKCFSVFFFFAAKLHFGNAWKSVKHPSAHVGV